MRRMHVAHFKARALSRQSAWTEGRNTALVGNFGEWIILVHELGQLTGSKKFLDGSRNRFCIDKVLRHQVFGLGKTQAFLHSTLDTDKTDTELVFGHFADAANTTVAKMINIVNR